MTSRRRTTPNRRWKNVAYVNVEIYNVKERRIDIVYLNVDINNVRQRRSIIVLFNLKFYNGDHHRNNVVTMCKKLKNKARIKSIKTFLSFK